MEALFGKQLFTSSGAVVPIEALAGHVVLLYFSASWCRPCQAFTPKLIELRKNVQRAIVHFEVVFVSKDRDERQFRAYFGKMPWLAPAFDAERSDKICDKFQVITIPHVAVLFPNNTAMTRDVVGAIQRDVTGAFIVDSWRAAGGVPLPVPRSTLPAAADVDAAAASAPSLAFLLQQIVYEPASRTAATRVKQQLALYFSNEAVDNGLKADLLEWYAAQREYAPADFVEVVFIPFGAPPAPAFVADMPWVTVRPQDPHVRELLNKYVKPGGGLPSLVAVDQRAGRVVCTTCAERLLIDGAHFPWVSAAWDVLETVPEDALTSSASLILLPDVLLPHAKQAAIDAFAQAARELRDAGATTRCIIFAHAFQCEDLRNKLDVDVSVVAYINSPEKKWAVMPDLASSLTTKALLAFHAAQQPVPLPF